MAMHTRVEQRTYAFAIKEVTAALAAWAVRLCPEPAPDNLSPVVRHMHAALLPSFKQLGEDVWVAHMTRQQLQDLIRDELENIPAVRAWSTPLRRSRVGHFFKIVPGGNLDLDALASNVVATVLLTASIDWSKVES